jgi:hypothetical protein
MTTTISTLAARVAFHEIPGRIVSAFALTISSSVPRATVRPSVRGDGGAEHVRAVTFVTCRTGSRERAGMLAP